MFCLSPPLDAYNLLSLLLIEVSFVACGGLIAPAEANRGLQVPVEPGLSSFVALRCGAEDFLHVRPKETAGHFVKNLLLS